MTRTSTSACEADKGEPKGSPFVTTSHVLNRLNAALSEQMLEFSGNDSNDVLNSANIQKSKTRFELQQRLPDGSAVPATRNDLATIDFENKVSQAAAFVQDLTVEQKLKWAEGQREYGNQLYHNEQFEESIDVYLTCLTVAADKTIEGMDRLLLFCKVMNNVALVALGQKWYTKTVHFCSMALQELAAASDDNSFNDGMEDIPTRQSNEMVAQKSKLYFKRAKAQRLGGEYKLALCDLKNAMFWLRKMDLENAIRSQLCHDVEKEQILLHQARLEAKRNRCERKRAMQQFLDAPKHGTSNEHEIKPLYEVTANMNGPREYSTLRALSIDPEENAIVEQDECVFSCWQRTRQLIVAGAQHMLDWLDERERQRHIGIRKTD